MLTTPRISVGPIPYLWPRARVFDFYHEMAASDADVFYLGETVCSKRRELDLEDWLTIAATLAAAGKEVVLSTLTLVEAESEVGIVRRICANGRYRVEANDYTAINLLGESPATAFVTGPSVNIYNGRTLGYLATLGLRRWVLPVELGHATLADLQNERPAGVETEVFAWGRLPLAYSARCFTARAANRSKDQCEFVCGQYPDGLGMATREDQEFLTFNGIQTQSAKIYSLLGEIPALRRLGVDVLRVSPQAASTPEIVGLFKRHAAADAIPPEAVATLARLAGAEVCQGYWRGDAGMAA